MWGRWRRSLNSKIPREHVTKAAVVQSVDQGEKDKERVPYPPERLQVCPQDREMEIQGQLVQEQGARELEGEEVLTGQCLQKDKKRK